MKTLKNELSRAVYETCEDASSAQDEFESMITNEESDVIFLHEFMNLAGVECSEEYVAYGWDTAELATAIIDGDIYTYTGSHDYKWHINVPDPHILEE